jgi:hypothetical protein
VGRQQFAAGRRLKNPGIVENSTNPINSMNLTNARNSTNPINSMNSKTPRN